MTPVESEFATTFPELAVSWKPDPMAEPEMVVYNQPLAYDLGLDKSFFATHSPLDVLSGNAVAEGSRPAAMVYAGHQFGHYASRLGDGRALLLGEVATSSGRVDLHVKGSGKTPLARNGDGKAELGPMLREYLVAEAMHALGVPSNRGLAVISTGEQVARQTGFSPGAVLARTAASHLRIGTFEYVARLSDPTATTRLANYVINRHFPELNDGSGNKYLGLLRAVAKRQAELVAKWMSVGFIHGVMNTDNMFVSGETLDYGPCAFMDRFDPTAVYSSIDQKGRYAFQNQPPVALWNLARLAETLLGPITDRAGYDEPQHAVDEVTDTLKGFEQLFEDPWQDAIVTKVGLDPTEEEDATLANEFLVLLAEQRVDFTGAFRSLANAVRGDRRDFMATVGLAAAAFEPWLERWTTRHLARSEPVETVAEELEATNPRYIPRNHLLDAALQSATAGDLTKFNALVERTSNPFSSDGSPLAEDPMAIPASPSFDEAFTTFCGT